MTTQKFVLVILLWQLFQPSSACAAITDCSSGTDWVVWFRCADDLKRSGRIDLAGEQYLELFVAARSDPSFHGVRLSFLLGRMIEIAEQTKGYKEKLQGLVLRDEELIRSGDAEMWTFFEWHALVRELNPNPGEYRVMFFDSLRTPIGSTELDLLFRIVMFEDLANLERWESLKDVLIRKANIQEQTIERIESQPVEDESARQLLAKHIEEYELVETGLRSLNLGDEADVVALRLKRARDRAIYLETALTPRQLEREIEEAGPAATLASLSTSQFDQICERIEAGPDDWMRLAVELGSRAEAETRAGINRCITLRIADHASSVIRAIQIYLPITSSDICNQPYPDEEKATLFSSRAREALDSILEPDLVPIAQQCARMLDRDNR